jgi:hypothetical protein
VWEKVKSTTQVSQKNGKAVHMLKPGIGKKRTKQEMEESKEEEQQLKANRNEYLKQAKTGKQLLHAHTAEEKTKVLLEQKEKEFQ